MGSGFRASAAHARLAGPPQASMLPATLGLEPVDDRKGERVMADENPQASPSRTETPVRDQPEIIPLASVQAPAAPPSPKNFDAYTPEAPPPTAVDFEFLHVSPGRPP